MTRDGAVVNLSAREMQLLRFFLANAGATLAREELLTRVWGYHRAMFTRTVDVHVASLRQKLEDEPRQPRFFLTVQGSATSSGRNDGNVIRAPVQGPRIGTAAAIVCTAGRRRGARRDPVPLEPGGERRHRRPPRRRAPALDDQLAPRSVPQPLRSRPDDADAGRRRRAQRHRAVRGPARGMAIAGALSRARRRTSTSSGARRTDASTSCRWRPARRRSTARRWPRRRRALVSELDATSCDSARPPSPRRRTASSPRASTTSDRRCASGGSIRPLPRSCGRRCRTPNGCSSSWTRRCCSAASCPISRSAIFRAPTASTTRSRSCRAAPKRRVIYTSDPGFGDDERARRRRTDGRVRSRRRRRRDRRSASSTGRRRTAARPRRLA